jgi:hypothetical protein
MLLNHLNVGLQVDPKTLRMSLTILASIFSVLCMHGIDLHQRVIEMNAILPNMIKIQLFITRAKNIQN